MKELRPDNFTSKLKSVMVFLLILNILLFIMMAIITYRDIRIMRFNLITQGHAVLASFEGGRRAFMRRQFSGQDRFVDFLSDLQKQRNVLNIVIYDEKGDPIFSTSKGSSPKIDIKASVPRVKENDELVFIYKPYVFRAGFGSNRRMNMMQPDSLGKNRRHMDNMPEHEKIFVGVLLDKSTFNKQIKANMFTLGIMAIVLILAAVTYFYVGRVIKEYIKSMQKLKSTEHEAEMGRMGQVLAHEIKNPLSSVSGLLSFTLKKTEDEKQKDYLNRCIDEVERLDTIVNDFLTYGKEINLNKTDTPLCSIVSKVTELLDHDAQQRGIIFETSCNEAKINLDAEKFLQVLFNLTLNAVQASPDNNSVKISGNKNSLSIVNNVKEKIEDSDKLFEPFYTTKTRGTGLGLAVVKRMCELHGFSIEVENTDPFTLTIKFN